MSADLKPTALSSQNPDTAVQMSKSDYSRLSYEDLSDIARLAKLGKTQREIAEFVGCSQQGVSKALQRMGEEDDTVRAVAKTKVTKAFKHWGRAIVKAADRGDHRPARELIELAHTKLRPQAANNSGGGGVTVFVAVPGGVGNPRPVIEVSPAKVIGVERNPTESLAITSRSHNDPFVNQAASDVSATEVTRYTDSE